MLRYNIDLFIWVWIVEILYVVHYVYVEMYNIDNVFYFP